MQISQFLQDGKSSVGTEFATFEDFQNQLELYENQEFCVFSISSSHKLQRNEILPNNLGNLRDRLKYEQVRYQCLFYGSPRAKKETNAESDAESDAESEAESVQNEAEDDTENDENASVGQNAQRISKRRQTKSNRQNCESYFFVRHHEHNGVHSLRIVRINENHNHQRSETLFKTLPKQRRKTLKEAEPYLKHVLLCKPSLQLVQADVTNSSENKGVVTRQDLKNYKNRKLNKFIGEDDLEKMISLLVEIWSRRDQIHIGHEDRIFLDNLSKKKQVFTRLIPIKFRDISSQYLFTKWRFFSYDYKTSIVHFNSKTC